MVTINLEGTLEGLKVIADTLYLSIFEDSNRCISIFISDFNIQYTTKSLPTMTSMVDDIQSIMREVDKFSDFNRHSEMIFKIEYTESTTKITIRRSGIPAINLCIAGFGGSLHLNERELEDDYE